MGVIDLKDKVMNLLLEELNDRVALSDYCITLIDLILPVKNSLTCGDNLLLLGYQGLKLHYCDNDLELCQSTDPYRNVAEADSGAGHS
jgi:hypothetical protein